MSDLTAELAAERRAAARLLLRCPLVTAESHPDEFPLIRRHAEDLARQFGQILGYRLAVESGFARLHKAGLGDKAGRELRRASDAPFTPRTYAYLALTLAVLVTSPEQLLLSEIVARVRAAAAEVALELGEPNRAIERRALVAALRQLTAWQVLSEVDGAVESYVGDAEAEALLTVDREIARRLVSGPIGRVSSAAELIALAAVPEQAGPRHAVRRRLVETPVVYVADLTEDERDWLRRNQRREQRIFEEFLGLDAEIRAEGVALVDPEDELSDLEFPGTGTVPWAALLLVERLAEGRRRPEREQLALDAEDGPPPEVRTTREIDVLLGELVQRHRKAWATRFTAAPEALREAVLGLLVRMCLLEQTEDGWRLLPAAGRYVPEVRYR
ncbi:TIGR02678 family protein [Actinomadura gamaensis]|uniref:TIGR02678 family protein n=1 Tax=Actinomadura gamaensis TaxID=1763541 RepID=A0ABV9U2K6_9ACTN